MRRTLRFPSTSGFVNKISDVPLFRTGEDKRNFSDAILNLHAKREYPGSHMPFWCIPLGNLRGA